MCCSGSAGTTRSTADWASTSSSNDTPRSPARVPRPPSRICCGGGAAARGQRRKFSQPHAGDHAMYDMKNLAKFEQLAELAPDAFKAFVAFDEAVVRGGVIPLKYKELIAVAVALTTQCPYCIEIHATKAKRAGAT